ncbi:hypothetical protein Q5H92_09400 [Hymenobacter sp. M29]|uniref:Outer membrane protein beta-barrel domain-containing protein n=1 Tax=Hymenobacter mellowenesis TaxID=3063995 RepID=A0ABT9A9Q7_9BACT|nr:hypothetical protein [Hymenobacter sp. M29]MDO7846570.1 hypothetical protein [Hymenobacter sp. M29]
MFLKFLLLLSGCLTASVALAQTATPTLDAPEAAKWRFFAEAGPKFSQFNSTYHSTNVLAFVSGGYPSEYSREFQVDNTYAAFAGVKALRFLSKHLAASGGAGLDMQQIDFTTTTRGRFPPFRTSQGEHVVRLLTRLRVDGGLHYALGLGTGSHLLAGLSLGQQVNMSRQGYSYSFVQPELSFTHGNVLVSARASFMPYNTTLPDIEEISRRDDRPVVERNEYRVSEFSLSLGVKL